jgi:hypothetical protein
VAQKLIAFVNSENHEDMLVLKELIEAGKVTPTIDKSFALSEVPKALSYLTEGRARGKVAISVREGRSMSFAKENPCPDRCGRNLLGLKRGGQVPRGKLCQEGTLCQECLLAERRPVDMELGADT